MTIFKDSHHFSRTLGDVWRQSLMTVFNDSAFCERTLRGRFREKSVKQPDGGAGHPTDLRAQRSFEHHIVTQRAPRSGVMYCICKNAGCPCPLLPLEISAMLKILMHRLPTWKFILMANRAIGVFALTLREILQSDFEVVQPAQPIPCGHESEPPAVISVRWGGNASWSRWHQPFTERPCLTGWVGMCHCPICRKRPTLMLLRQVLRCYIKVYHLRVRRC